jgi:hypothetical protein
LERGIGNADKLRDEERFLAAQADAFEDERDRKNRPAPLGMTGFGSVCLKCGVVKRDGNSEDAAGCVENGNPLPFVAAMVASYLGDCG